MADRPREPVRTEEFRAEEARKLFADLLNAAQWEGKHVTITRNGRRAAMLVPVAWYDEHAGHDAT